MFGLWSAENGGLSRAEMTSVNFALSWTFVQHTCAGQIGAREAPLSSRSSVENVGVISFHRPG